MQTAKNHLTSTIGYRTFVHEARGDKEKEVDATTKKLVQRLRELKRQQDEVKQEISVIERSLKIAGIRLGGSKSLIEESYAREHPFANMPLSEACLSILADFNVNDREWLTKSQIEYYLVRGGYEFSAKDSKNSVDVTLRRLATDARCVAERSRGSKGNLYRGIAQSNQAKLVIQLQEYLQKRGLTDTD